MPDQPEQNSSEEKGRIHIEDLPPQPEELKPEEARDVKGGGGSVSGSGDIRTKNPGFALSQ